MTEQERAEYMQLGAAWDAEEGAGDHDELARIEARLSEIDKQRREERERALGGGMMVIDHAAVTAALRSHVAPMVRAGHRPEEVEAELEISAGEFAEIVAACSPVAELSATPTDDDIATAVDMFERGCVDDVVAEHLGVSLSVASLMARTWTATVEGAEAEAKRDEAIADLAEISRNLSERKRRSGGEG